MESPAFDLTGRVENVLVADQFGSIVSAPQSKIQVIRGHGIKSDNHAGVRLADVRERELLSFGFSRGMEIANYREFSAVSAEELTEIGKAMDLPGQIPPGCLGENMIISGIPELTHLPTGTMLFFRKDERQLRTAVLVVWAENEPCQGPGKAIQECFPNKPGLATIFPKSAIGKRGVVGTIYSSGYIHAGDMIIAKIPRQRLYDPN